MPHRLRHVVFVCVLASGLFACARSQGIFPQVVTSVSEAEAILPNPVSIVTDEARSQIIVANSNVDVFFDDGSLAVLTVDASDTSAPSLSAAQIIAAPNFAGQIHFDGTNSTVYVPFREASSSDESVDQIRSYAVTGGALTAVTTTTAAANPFGTTGDSSRLFVVSDEVLNLYDKSLNLSSTIDLTTAEDAGLDDSDAEQVEYVAYDALYNRTFVSNANGRLFCVDLANGRIASVIDGPESTRNLLIDGDLLYALDPVASAVWVFDVDLLSAPDSAPDEQDDSLFLIATVPVGLNPNGMALDSAAGRLYVGNSGENTISVIDTLSFEEIARVSVDSEDLSSFSRGGDNPFALSLGTFNGTTFLFVAGYGDNSVVMINTRTLKVVEVYPNNTL